MKERPQMSADDQPALFKEVWLIFFVGDSVYNIFGDINVMRNRNFFIIAFFVVHLGQVGPGCRKVAGFCLSAENPRQKALSAREQKKKKAPERAFVSVLLVWDTAHGI